MTLKGFSDPEVRARAMATRLARKNAKDMVQGKNKTASANIQARWSAETASEVEVDAHFRVIEIEEGLALLARMRRNTELASKALNARISLDDTKARCATCQGAKKPNKQWALIRPRRDEKTGQILNIFYCSMACVALENQRTQGTYGVSGQGMTKDMNPHNHPKQV